MRGEAASAVGWGGGIEPACLPEPTPDKQAHTSPIHIAQICHTTPMLYLTRTSEAGTLRLWSTTVVCSPSAEEPDTDATCLYLRSYSPAHHQSAGDHRV